MKTLPFAVLLLAGCQLVTGSGVTTTTSRAVPAFRRVAVASGLSATITTGARAVSIRADDNLQPLIETVVEGDTLQVRLRPLTILGFHGPLEVTIVNDVIEGLEASGAATITSALTPIGVLHVSASGASSVSAGPVASTSVVLEASGASDITLGGAATGGTARASGSSTVDLRQLPLESMTLELSGASALTGRVSAVLAGSASGASVATIIGTPTSTVQVSGASRVVTGAQ
jgi:hypothetical protein